MTIKPTYAAIAAVSSVVLIFGQTAHAETFPAGGPAMPLPPTPPSMSAPGGAMAPSISTPPNMNPGPSMQPPAMPQQSPPQAPPVAPAQVAAPQAQPPVMPQSQPPMQAMGPLPAQVNGNNAKSELASKPKASSSSNTYVKGTCTWYVKNKRPDLPNGLGNGGQWVKNAAKRGFSTGTSPKAGAVGEQPGHVVYIESVSGSSVTISEMNYAGKKNVVHKRTVKASTFKYIY